MVMKTINDIIRNLAKNGVNVTIRLGSDEPDITVEGHIYSDGLFPDIHVFTGATVEEAFRKLSQDDAFAGKLESNLFLRLNQPDEAEQVLEVVDVLSITNPYLSDLRIALDKGIQSAADAVDADSTATVTAKLVLNEDPFAPEFENDAKLFAKAKFDVSVNIKREVNKYIGSVQAFGTRVVDGRMLLINPDRQISLDESIKQAEEEVGNVPPEKNLMADAPVDPQEPDENAPDAFPEA